MQPQINFPSEYLDHKYRLIHFNFFVQYAILAKIKIELVESTDEIFVADDRLVFSCLVNGKQVIFDYADHSARNWKALYPDIPYFKFQKTSSSVLDAIPLGPPIVGLKNVDIQGATMREYQHIRNNFNYVPGDAILNKQFPNGAAVDRRNNVHALLLNNFDNIDIDAKTDQSDFWRQHENCLVSVCVPGATNNMVDRGQMELMGLGVCTISPRLDTIFTYNKLLEPDIDYIQCKDDYSDLVEKIEYLQVNKDVCKKIGDNAQLFFNNHYAPENYWQWILENINGETDD